MPITSAIAARAMIRPGSPLGGAPPAARHSSTPIPISSGDRDQRRADEEGRRTEQQHDQQAEQDRADDVGVAAVAEDAAVVVGGDEREQADVGEDADAPGEHEDDEGDPEEDRVDAEVAPEAAGDAADQLVGRGAREAPDALRGRRGVGFWGLRPALRRRARRAGRRRAAARSEPSRRGRGSRGSSVMGRASVAERPRAISGMTLTGPWFVPLSGRGQVAVID